MMRNRPILLLLALGIGSCSSTENTQVDRGSGYSYRQGFPEIRIAAVGFFNEEDVPSIQVVTDLVKGSLIYRSQADTFKAEASVNIQLLRSDVAGGASGVSETLPVRVQSLDPLIRRSGEVMTLVQDYQVSPGEYTVVVTVEDQVSTQKTALRTTVSLPDPGSQAWGVTGIRLFSGDSPITTYDVPARFDSIRFSGYVIAPTHVDTVRVNASIIRFESDKEFARQMAALPINPGSIEYKGIDYFNRRIESSKEIRVANTGRPIRLDIDMAVPEKGNYRFEWTLPQTIGEVNRRARDFSVKSPFYPNIRTVQELSEPMGYLMTRREFRELRAIQDPDSLKQAMDAFWLKNVRNRVKAARVISQYFSRVEEANKLFSNFKEGWKTDMGMIYILFGPPWYVEESLEYQTWFYSYNRNDPRTVFTFYRPKIQNVYFPFNHYILVRDRNYHSVEYQQIQAWLNGDILEQR